MQARTPGNKTGGIFHFLVPAYCQGPVGGLDSIPRNHTRFEGRADTTKANYKKQMQQRYFYFGKTREFYAIALKYRTILKLEPIFFIFT